MNQGFNNYNAHCVIRLSTDSLSIDKLSELKEAIADIIERGVKNIYINLQEFEELNDLEIDSLLEVQKVALFNRAKVKLSSLQKKALKTLTQTKLDKVFEVCDPDNNDQCIIIA